MFKLYKRDWEVQKDAITCDYLIFGPPILWRRDQNTEISAHVFEYFYEGILMFRDGTIKIRRYFDSYIEEITINNIYKFINAFDSVERAIMFVRDTIYCKQELEKGEKELEDG